MQRIRVLLDLFQRLDCQLVFLTVFQQPEDSLPFVNENYEGVRFRLQMDLIAGSRSEAPFSLQPKTPSSYMIRLKEK
jgi:hypothetical protein